MSKSLTKIFQESPMSRCMYIVHTYLNGLDNGKILTAVVLHGSYLKLACDSFGY